MNSIVLQSHRPGRLHGWLCRCCASVEAWADAQGLAYEWTGDELFERVSPVLRDKYAAQPVVLSDLARILWIQEKLDEGYDHAIWCDADLLVLRPFDLTAKGDCFGRECWVQAHNGRLRSYRKIHNAWLQFARGSTTLPFYIERATALLERAEAPVVPQFIGPKLLTAWHNIAAFAVEERVGMLSPAVMADLLGGTTQALDLFSAGHEAQLCAVNLCASLEGVTDGAVCHGPEDYDRLMHGLLDGDLANKL